MRHAFVDESRRPGLYLVTAALVDTARLATVATSIRKVQPHGQQRSHFSALDDRRRRRLLPAYVALGVPVLVTVSAYSRGDDQPAREACLRALLATLARWSVSHLVLDTRQEQRDALDRSVIARAIAAGSAPPNLSYGHRGSRGEPLLSLPDAFGWTDGPWRKMIAPTVIVIQA